MDSVRKYREPCLLSLFLWIFLSFRGVSSQTPLTQEDIRSSGNTTWNLTRSPYRIQQTIVIPKGSLLLIEPGVRLEFLPGTGLLVQGALKALGEPQHKILMTSSMAPIISALSVPEIPATATFNDEVLNFRRGIRLVRGESPAHGQIQLFHRNKWRSVCTHSYNWTAEDIRVACVQMGFMEGIFDAWVDHINDTHYMLLQRARCSGGESSLLQCADYSNVHLGKNICEGHPDMLIRCLRHAPPIQRRHWMGIRFDNASYSTQYPYGRTLEVNVTQSLLQHVDIFYAGAGPNGQLISAIEANGAPPVVSHCTVQFSAFNGLNFTHTTGAVNIFESRFRWNKGHGLSVNSTEGNVTVRNVVSEFNAGDGIHYVHNETFFQLPDTFCTRPQLGLSQSYPVYASVNRLGRNFSPREEDCVQRFYVEEPLVLTVHFLLLEALDSDAAYLEFRDGSDSFSPLLAVIPVRNGSHPDSINTDGSRIWVRFRSRQRGYVRFNLKITASLAREFDLNVTSSIVAGNQGRGVSVKNMRSGLFMEKVTIRESGYRAGVHVEGGSGDVNVSYSVITKNAGDGINITYFGGRRNVTVSKITQNEKRGIAVGFNETYHIKPVVQRTDITHSFIEYNGLGGILYGNFCTSDSILNITNNSFVGNQGVGVELWSCLKKRDDGQSNTMTSLLEWNTFRDSSFVALKIRPLALISAHIGNNTFHHHKKGVIWIQNMEYPFHDEWDRLPADVSVGDNTFAENEGPFVVMVGLSDTSPNQKGHLRYNYFKDNAIVPATAHIRRHQSEGVVIVGSSNVVVYWNSFDNPRSPVWLTTHLRNPGKTINATANWWGTTDESLIYNRVFGGKDRFDLSHIVFRPYLARPDLVDPEAIAPPPEYRKPFVRGNVIGGIYGDRMASLSGEYQVDSDLVLQPNSILTIRAGTKMSFDAGIGILSQGKIVVEGSVQAPVVFEMKRSAGVTVYLNESVVRLVNGPTYYEGRLEVFVDGQWGTVCNDEWNVKNAGVVCRQLGMAHAPEDFGGGLLHYGQGNGPILCSNVKCDDWDWDISSCPHFGHLEHTCSHLRDVGVKCRQPGWAGMRIPITADQSIIEHAIFRQAGILDFDTQAVSSALQIDFNINHRIKNCVFENNTNAGLVIMNNHMNPGNSIVQGCRFRKNSGSGLVIRSPGLSVVDGEFTQNERSAFLYDPKISRYQQREFISFLERKNNWRTYVVSSKESRINIQIDRDQEVLLRTSNLPHEKNQTVTVEVTLKDMAYILGVQVLNPPLEGTTESLRVFNGDPKANDVEIWLLDERVNHLPATSVSYRIVIEYYSGFFPSGNIILQLSPIRRNQLTTRQLTTSLESCKFDRNWRSIDIVHYDMLDQHENPFEFPRRFNNESVRIVKTQVLNSIVEGLRVTNMQPWINVHRSYESAEFYLLKSLSQITYTIEDTSFGQNGAGISFVREGFLNVEASGNIYQWTITKSAIDGSSGPALTFDFPLSLGKRNYAMWDKRYSRAEAVKLEYDQMMEKFWQEAIGQMMYDTAYDFRLMEREHLRRLGYAAFHASTENLFASSVHSLRILNSRISANRNSFMKFQGDFIRFNFTGNDVSRNQCPPHSGLMKISGMEKEMMISENVFVENQCKFITEFDISSHTASTGRVPGNFIRNDVRRNRGSGLMRVAVIPDTNPDSYAVAVKGVQRVNVTQNLLENPGMDYEFISGLLTDRLDMELEVRHNWWGSLNSSVIRDRVFDFDDWNCFAHAEFKPFLDGPVFGAGLSTREAELSMITNEAPLILGGRLTRSVTLTKRPMPYIVNRDLTVMPYVTLTVESGVRVEVFPNAGILVLGDLKAVGRIGDPIVFAPVTRTSAQRAKVPVSLSQTRAASDIGNVRLFGGTNPSEGYLEVLNMTTNQWIPVWHKDFSLRDAAVVCRHLSLPVDDIQAWRGPRAEDFGNVRTWLRPFYCKGNEMRVYDCDLPLMELEVPPKQQLADLFVYMRCQGSNLPGEAKHWGGIRFAHSALEFAENVNDNSILEDVEVIGAGMLHGERASGAIEIIHRNPKIERVKVLNSASSGITVINPSGNLILHHATVENSVLTGINILLLHGDLKGDSSQMTYDPIRRRFDVGMGSLPPATAQFVNGVHLGSNIFGLVDICSADKVVYVRKRVVILFRYDSASLRKDCVKIFQVTGTKKTNRMQELPTPKIAFRLLEWNLHESEFLPNSDFIELYEGNVYNHSDYRFLKRISASDKIRQAYDSSKETLTVHLSTTTAPNPETYGFIAEVITLPPAYVGISREAKLNVTSSAMKNNRRGGLNLYTTGEFNPVVAIERCLFQSNGEKVFHNFSTSYHAAYLDVQNTPLIEVQNNDFKNNQGGLHIAASSMTAATRMHTEIRGNLFHSNRVSSALSVSGRSTPYQEAIITKNYFFDNTGQFSDNIFLERVVGNFSENQVLFNLGRYTLNLDGFGQVRLTDYQTIYRNNFIRNVAYGRPELHLIDFKARDKTTIFATGSGQSITYNVFNNPDSDLDLLVTNQSEMFPLNPTFINAKHNYWGTEYDVGVAGKIKDKSDDRVLYEVEYLPFFPSNTSLMDGKCYPGFTLIQDSCYQYVGGVTTFAEALLFCQLINATLPYADKVEYQLTRFIHDQQRNFDWRLDGAWVRSYAYSSTPDKCILLRNQRAWPSETCEEPRPFLCERDTAFVIVSKSWHTGIAYVAGVIAAMVGIVLVVIFICCWMRKSQKRQKEAFKRRDSIRESIRISRSSLAFASSMNLNSGPISVSRTNLFQIPNLPPVVETHFPSEEDSNSIGKSSRTFNSSVEFCPDYEFFEARNDALIFDPYSKMAKVIRKHLTPADLTFSNIAYIDSSNSRTSTRTDTMSFDTIDVKPAFIASYPEDEEDSPKSLRYRNTILLETDM